MPDDLQNKKPEPHVLAPQIKLLLGGMILTLVTTVASSLGWLPSAASPATPVMPLPCVEHHTNHPDAGR